MRTIIVFLALIMVGGCASMDNTEKGAGIGAVSGAGIGGIIGHQSGKGGQGAAIGGAAGAILGGLTGHQMDKKQKANNASYTSLTQVVQMTKEGLPASVIVNELKASKSVYRLDSETISYLKNNGVSDQVINYMMSTAK